MGIFGWGVVAPRSPNVDAFARNLERGDSWLEPFNGFGPDNFLVGVPEFSFDDYQRWVVERFKPNRFSQLESKMGLPVKYAIGAFIQALGQNPGLEQELQTLGTAAHIYIGTGLGDIVTQYEQSLAFHRAQRRWERFWANPERNSERRVYEDRWATENGAAPTQTEDGTPIPPRPESVTEEDRDLAEEAWWSFWAQRSPQLQTYLDEMRAIEAIGVEGDVESGKLKAMKDKRRALRKLQEKWGTPQPPWQSVSSNFIWNIDNIAAAQISMLGRIAGMSMAVGGACSTFGITLKLALDAIRSGEAKAVVIGATDPPPSPLLVGAFYNARVISADAQVSKPLTELRGTHIAGGSVVWIVGDYDYLRGKGFTPLGMEPLAVGVTSDADHIITPSKEGPTESMRMALAGADIDGSNVVSWDLHATATPGDFNEVEMVRDLMPRDLLVTARKGTFGHGMSAGGGWELTAQYLGYERGEIYPTPLRRQELNEQIATVHEKFAFEAGCSAPRGAVGKLSMGVGGINACVVSRPLGDDESGG
ncbi:MAG: beta-ketoacyl synthase N-terminal-like domain-containing protein [Acidobacteriota bacterium]